MKKNNNKKDKKKWSLFSKVFLGYVCVLVIAGIIVDVILWNFLADYERNENKKAQNISQGVTVTPTPKATKPAPTATPVPTEVPKTMLAEFKIYDGVTVYVDGEAIDTAGLDITETKDKEFDGLYSFVNTYAEYENLPSKVTMPSLKVFSKEIYETAVVTAKDASGADVEILKYQDLDGKIFYSTGFKSDESKYEEVTNFAWDFATSYSYFVAGDRSADTIAKYFPSNSKYYRIVASVDTAWYTKHADLPTYSEKEVKTFKGYSEDLFFVQIYMKETIYAMYYDNERVDRDVELGLWIANLDGNYKVCGMVY